jgi:hypothetical protein
MGLRVAVANGNWSSTSTWYLGVKPAAGDIVASNGFTVTIDENVNVDSITNTAQSTVSSIPIMTGATTPSGIASASQEYDPNTYAAWKAFDGSVANNSNHWLSFNGAFVSPQWLQYQFSTAKIIVAYSIQATFSGQIPTAWQFQGWDGAAWVTLDTVSGVASIASPYTKIISNTTAYIRYRLNFTAASVPSSYINVGEIKMFETAADSSTAAAGGGFVISSSVTVTCTSLTGIQSGASTVLTIPATSPSVVTINSNLTGATSDNVTNVLKSGNCTLNVVGSTRFIITGANRHNLNINAAGTVNFVGGVTGAWNGSRGILMNSGSTGAILNITGDINPSKQLNSSQNAQHLVIGSVCTVNVTGNVYGDYGNSIGILVNSVSSIYIVGNVYGGQNITGGNGNGISSSVAGLISIVGIISAQHTAPTETYGVVSTSGSAINLFSGPFISGPYGMSPYLCGRMHLIPSSTSYYEFRDETTNGALSPGAVAPATRLYSPSTVVDAPATSNVRSGTVYALGTRTGTMVVPTANKVRIGIAVDNTVGTSVLTVADVVNSVWGALSSGLTTSGSIGERAKNSLTVAALGDQMAAFN